MSVFMRWADTSNAGSLASRMRSARMAFFLSLLRDLPRPIRILDVGGTAEAWERPGAAEAGGLEVTLVNQEPQVVARPGVVSVVGDARAMPQFAAAAFDVVYSNSVLEHFGTAADQRQMANEVRRIGRRYFVQTPYRYFPIEPHVLLPGFQFLPIRVRAALLQHRQLGWVERRPTRVAALEKVRRIRLLDRREVQHLFPEAHIARERFWGLTKSLIAYHGWDSSA